MLNKNSIQSVDASRFDRGFVKPLYESYCFANIPTSIRALMMGMGKPTLPANTLGEFGHHYDAVVLFLVDGFGWRFFERYADEHPYVKHLLRTAWSQNSPRCFPQPRRHTSPAFTLAGHLRRAACTSG